MGLSFPYLTFLNLSLASFEISLQITTWIEVFALVSTLGGTQTDKDLKLVSSHLIYILFILFTETSVIVLHYCLLKNLEFFLSKKNS